MATGGGGEGGAGGGDGEAQAASSATVTNTAPISRWCMAVSREPPSTKSGRTLSPVSGGRGTLARRNEGGVVYLPPARKTLRR